VPAAQRLTGTKSSEQYRSRLKPACNKNDANANHSSDLEKDPALTPTVGGGQERCDVLLTGTGSLAQSILLSWPVAASRQHRRRVVILSRSEVRAHDLAVIANYRAAATGCDLECIAVSTRWMKRTCKST